MDSTNYTGHNSCMIYRVRVFAHLKSMEIGKDFLGKLFEQATENPRLRQNYDLRTSPTDISQRMLNALLPGTVVPIHRHPNSTETVVCLCGKLDEVIYEEVVSYENTFSKDFQQSMDAQDVTRKVEYREMQRIHICPAQAKYGYQIPKGTWHTVEVIEPSVIFEAKDGKYGEDGSETLDAFKIEKGQTIPTYSTFSNSLGDLEKNIEYLIGMERHSGSMDVITPLYVSRMLNVPLEEVEKVMKDMNE